MVKTINIIWWRKSLSLCCLNTCIKISQTFLKHNYREEQFWQPINSFLPQTTKFLFATDKLFLQLTYRFLKDKPFLQETNRIFATDIPVFQKTNIFCKRQTGYLIERNRIFAREKPDICKRETGLYNRQSGVRASNHSEGRLYTHVFRILQRYGIIIFFRTSSFVKTRV